MPTITTKDGVEIFIRTGGWDSRSNSAMGGRFRLMTGTTRMLFFLGKGLSRDSARPKKRALTF